MKITLDNSVAATLHHERIHYLGDTMPGSGGAPVLDRHWQVVALHRARGMPGGHHPDEGSQLMALAQAPRLKEGIPIRAILPLIEQFLPRR